MSRASGGDFLRPNACAQAKLRGKVEERQRAKKAKSKVEAADRKHKRDADKERIAAIEEELAANKAKREAKVEKTETTKTTESQNPQTPFQTAALAAQLKTVSAEDIQRDQVCNDYLDGSEMLGRSAFNDKEFVKTLCGEGTRVFNKDRKLWGTTNHEALEKLMNSHRWSPFGVTDEWHLRLLSLAAERVQALHRKNEATNFSKVKREATILRELSSTQETVSHEDAAIIAAARARGQREALLREWFTTSTPEERAEIEALALNNGEFLDKTQGLVELGPVVGSSTEGRVLRWLSIEIYGARCKYERDPRYWDAEFMATVEAKGRAKAVARLKSLVNAATQ